MKKSRFSLWHFPRLFVIITCTIFLSFAAHDIQLNHAHPAFGQGEQHEEKGHAHNIAASDYLHGTDRKIFFLIFLALITFGVTRSVLPFSSPSRFVWRRSVRRTKPERHDFFLHLFKSGVLHPKLCE